MEHRPLILAFLVALVISCASGVERQSERRRQCPDPNSYGRNCFIYRDQCKNSRQCQQSGQRCCLVAGCGHECVDLLANNSVYMSSA
ncbi:uncharacterized protein LOC108669639 isoform X2 [Hyalella azteca]|uniref:Uncharacterized protein LOC108669639 isoform X2 n=1 Tax=Hyalella azteca TaxID=294128 RepID=A0A8B7NFW7_HYAAZ|nr:uncharacterized protein LOC108669639 isoform X2 [Hyalella azteca]